jgi:uncharacterized iron-regulated membrane protein
VGGVRDGIAGRRSQWVECACGGSIPGLGLIGAFAAAEAQTVLPPVQVEAKDVKAKPAKQKKAAAPTAAPAKSVAKTEKTETGTTHVDGYDAKVSANRHQDRHAPAAHAQLHLGRHIRPGEGPGRDGRRRGAAVHAGHLRRAQWRHLVDAETGALTDMRELPWYVTTLLVSQPLHFGDYGGMPLKLIWAVLDIITIVVLGSGLYLWIKRRRIAGEDLAARLRLVDAGAAKPEHGA